MGLEEKMNAAERIEIRVSFVPVPASVPDLLLRFSFIVHRFSRGVNGRS